MNAISRRFQNRRAPSDRDPLAQLEIDPLRPLNNLLWGYVQDEQHRLSVAAARVRVRPPVRLHAARQGGRRARAPPTAARSSSRRSTTCCTGACEFFKQDDDTTVIADAFPVLNALKEMHYILSQGAHNQFGDLPSHGAARDADAAVDARPARDARVPRRRRIMVRLPRGVDGPRRRDEDAAGLDRHQRACTSATWRCSASRSCCRIRYGALERRSTTRRRPPTGRATGGRRSRATSTPTARSPGVDLTAAETCGGEVDRNAALGAAAQAAGAQQRTG